MVDDNEIRSRAERVFRMRRLALRLLYLTMALLLLALPFRSAHGALATGLLVAAGLLLAAFLAISLIYWRCPACGRRFQLRHSGQESRMAHCPFCGVELRRI